MRYASAPRCRSIDRVRCMVVSLLRLVITVWWHYTMSALRAGCGLRYNMRTKKRTKRAAAPLRRAALVALAVPSMGCGTRQRLESYPRGKKRGSHGWQRVIRLLGAAPAE